MIQINRELMDKINQVLFHPSPSWKGRWTLNYIKHYYEEIEIPYKDS